MQSTTFRFFIGGYFSGHFEIILKNDELRFFVSEYPMRPNEHDEPTHIVSLKDNIDWQNLVNYITGLNWEQKFWSEILDGIQWELIFKNESKEINCFGSNAFPADFDKLTRLIKKITQKHNIPDDLVG